MGFFDKIKGAMNAMTGNAAKVELEFLPAIAFPGDKVTVKIKATSTGQEVKSKGVYVDLAGLEEIKIKKGVGSPVAEDLSVSKNTYEQAIPLATAFVLQPNETKLFEGTIQIPATAQPTYAGAYTSHEWKLRGRVEAFGNDPDSGYLPIKIGSKPN